MRRRGALAGLVVVGGAKEPVPTNPTVVTTYCVTLMTSVSWTGWCTPLPFGGAGCFSAPAWRSCFFFFFSFDKWGRGNFSVMLCGTVWVLSGCYQKILQVIVYTV